MRSQKDDDNILYFKYSASKLFPGGMLGVGLIGTIIGILYSSISIVSGFLIIGLAAGLYFRNQ